MHYRAILTCGSLIVPGSGLPTAFGTARVVIKRDSDQQQLVCANEVVAWHLAQAYGLRVPPGFLASYDGRTCWVSVVVEPDEWRIYPENRPSIPLELHDSGGSCQFPTTCRAAGLQAIVFSQWILNFDYIYGSGYVVSSEQLYCFDFGSALLGNNKAEAATWLDSYDKIVFPPPDPAARNHGKARTDVLFMDAAESIADYETAFAQLTAVSNDQIYSAVMTANELVEPLVMEKLLDMLISRREYLPQLMTDQAAYFIRHESRDVV